LQVQERPPSLVQENLPVLVQERYLFQVLEMFLLQVLEMFLLQVQEMFLFQVLEMFLLQAQEMFLLQVKEMFLLQVLVMFLLLEQVKPPFQAVVMQPSLVQEEMRLSLAAQARLLLKEEPTVPWHQMLLLPFFPQHLLCCQQSPLR